MTREVRRGGAHGGRRRRVLGHRLGHRVRHVSCRASDEAGIVAGDKHAESSYACEGELLVLADFVNVLAHHGAYTLHSRVPDDVLADVHAATVCHMHGMRALARERACGPRRWGASTCAEVCGGVRRRAEVCGGVRRCASTCAEMCVGRACTSMDGGGRRRAEAGGGGRRRAEAGGGGRWRAVRTSNI